MLFFIPQTLIMRSLGHFKQMILFLLLTFHGHCLSIYVGNLKHIVLSIASLWKNRLFVKFIGPFDCQLSVAMIKYCPLKGKSA